MKLPHTDEIPNELYEAARVVDFVEERESGRWRTTHFTVTDGAYAQKILQIDFGGESEARKAIKKARAVPPGQWVSLQRRMTTAEKREVYYQMFKAFPEDAEGLPSLESYIPPESDWVPVMSDTPAEICEHAHALNNARGRVLITGLGLGCLPHALLSLDDVTRIDIVEIDPDVIELSGAYFTDPRVHIHRGSAVDPSALPSDLRWDYAWHDIWTHISARNLDPRTAEHGISYGMLFDLYEARTTQQSAWAFEQALEVLEAERREEAEERAYRDSILAMPKDEWWKPLYEDVLRSQVGGMIPKGTPVPDTIRRLIDPKGDLALHVREKVAEPGFEEELRHGAVTDGLESIPIGNPNDDLTDTPLDMTDPT